MLTYCVLGQTQLHILSGMANE